MTTANIGYTICAGHIKPRKSDCVECKHDYDTNHHPNNLDCPDRELITVIDGTCIEHLRYLEGLPTIKKVCKDCGSDFLNRFCDEYYPYPVVKYELFLKNKLFLKELEKRKIDLTPKLEEAVMRYVMIMNFGVLKSDRRQIIDYDTISDDVVKELEIFRRKGL